MNINKGIVTSGYISITESYAVIAVNSENLCYCRIIFKMHNFKYKLQKNMYIIIQCLMKKEMCIHTFLGLQKKLNCGGIGEWNKK